MSGYTRQSTATIIPGAEVQATPINAEFNQLQTAFHGTSGHTHDGSVGAGPKIDLLLSVTGTLPVGYGGTGADNAPGARTNLFGLSTTVDNTLPRFDGTTGALQPTGVVVSDANNVSGVNSLTVTSGGSLAGSWTTLGTVTTMGLLGGSINGTTIGDVTPSTAVFTTLTSTSSTTTTLTATNLSASGTFALTGDQVQVSEGGTGATTAAGARANLGVEPLPPGMIVAYAMSSPPAGWLECTGSTVSRVTYANLFAAIGTIYGNGDGSTTFGIPDLRGEFLRGLDSARGVDTGRVIGSAQAEATKAHVHTGTTANEGAHTHTLSAGVVDAAGYHAHNVAGNTGYVSANHYHYVGGGTSGRTAAHTHSYSSALGGNDNAGGVSIGTPATTNTSTESADHAHNFSVNSGNFSADHYHAVSGYTDGQGTHAHTLSGSTAAGTNHSHTFTTDTTVGTETRPRNVAVMYCIKT